MHRGYIKLWRCTLEKRIFQNDKLFRFAMYCLMSASHKEHTVLVGLQSVRLEPGQFVFGRRKAASFLNLSEQTVRSLLQTLEKIEFLTIKATNKYSIISIINWVLYQSDDECDQPTNQHASNQQLTNKQPATNQQLTTNKNVKNTNNTPIVPKGDESTYSTAFETFWSVCPKKVGKDAAYRSWQKIGKRNGTSPTQIVNAMVAQIKSDHFRGNDGQDYFPNPATWLNQGRWKDEINSRKPATTPPTETFITGNPYADI